MCKMHVYTATRFCTESMADDLNLTCSVKLSEILNLDGFMQD